MSLNDSTDETAIPLVAVFKEDSQAAIQIAAKWDFQLKKTVDKGLYLQLEAGKLSLLDADKPKEGGVFVDFASEAITYRRKHGGGKQEFIARAVGLKGKEGVSVVDATGGLGRDAFLLASLGCKVTLIERSPVVAALLENGLERAALNVELESWLPKQLKLVYGDSKSKLLTWGEQEPHDRPDVVYLDPMFPHRKKSALVKKEMRLFQELLGDDADADELLLPALELAGSRVVVKRPASAGPLAESKPNAAVKSKKHRFDIYLTHWG